MITGGAGCHIKDRDGNRLLDAFAGLYCVNVGYGRKEIAEAKMADLNATDLDQAAKIIAGSARSMGLTVEG